MYYIINKTSSIICFKFDLLHEPQGMSPFPAGEGVRGESCVHQGQVSLEQRIGQIGEVRPQLV